MKLKSIDMKKLVLFILALGLYQFCDAQIYMRTKKNMGIYGQLNTADFNPEGNFSFQTGITKQLGRFFLPEIGYRQMIQNEINRSFQLNDPNRTHFITTAMIFRAPLVVMNKRKKGRSCRGEVLEIFCGPELFYRLNDTQSLDENLFSAIRGGLGIYHFRTGFSKTSKAWTVKLEAYYRYQFDASNATFNIPNEFGLQMRILRYKVYDFVRN